MISAFTCIRHSEVKIKVKPVARMPDKREGGEREGERERERESQTNRQTDRQRERSD